MKNEKNNNGRDDNRKKLSEVVPLLAPFLLNIEPGNICNFKCNYCFHSGKNNLKKEYMSWETFLTTVNQASEFISNYKIVNLQGMGEPLLNPYIVDMVRYISQKNISDRIEITTNGSCLSELMSKNLVDAGLTRLVISLEGLSDQEYEKTCGVKVDFDKLVEKIKFFYLNKKNCKLHIKIVDSAIKQSDYDKFYEMFKEISDSLYIEHTLPLFNNVDYSKILNNNSKTETRYGYSVENLHCCPLIFYSIFIRANGDASPCCFTPTPIVLGNVKNETLKEIWNGNIRKDFLKLHLRKKRYDNIYCKTCNQPTLTSHPMDSLDDFAEEILERID